MIITIIALLWSIVGIVAAAIVARKHNQDFTLGDLFISALLGPIVPLSIWNILDIVIRRRK